MPAATIIFGIIIFSILFSACSKSVDLPSTEEILPTASSLEATPYREEPTPIPEPRAAIVNDEGIPLVWLEGEVERYLIAQEKLGNEDIDEAEARKIVLNDLIDQTLFAQAARSNGKTFTDDEVNNRFDALAKEVDLDAWMLEWGYTSEELLMSLRLQMLVAYQRDLITSSVPELAEQVELRQILAITEGGAERAWTSLKSGTPFDDLAAEFSPSTGGYLGWAPRGYLLIPEVEEAAFNQEVGTYTEIIKSDIGYHILFVIAREVRPLTTDARLTLERQVLKAWVEERREESIIDILVE